MNCANHPEVAAAAYCRTCGKPLCAECKREAEGTIFCAEHLPVVANAVPPNALPPNVSAPYTSPYTAPVGAPLPGATSTHSPALALILGFIPGVGAIYNGQYAKGLIHAVVFGLIVSLLDSHRSPGGMEPLLGILLAAWIFYMAFEAFHTAKVKAGGGRLGEISGLMDIDRDSGRFPVGAIVLIGLGGILLLDTTNLISIERLIRLWPVGLILIGAYMLYERMGSGVRPPAEVRDERR